VEIPANVQLDTTTNSLSPPERGAGPGRGDLSLEEIDILTPALRVMAFSLAAQSGFFYSAFFAITERAG
jgi:hypothetical protein